MVNYAVGSNIVAFKDTRGLPYPTVRHTKCSLLLENSSGRSKCPRCVAYRPQLNVLLNRCGNERGNTDPTSHTNYRYLTDSEKNSRLKELHHTNRLAQRKIAHLTEKLKEVIEIEGEQMDETTHADLKQIMEENNHHIETQYPKDSFMYIPLLEPTLTKKNLKGMRWYPLVIRWCLYLRHHSNKAVQWQRDQMGSYSRSV